MIKIFKTPAYVFVFRLLVRHRSNWIKCEILWNSKL